MPYSGRPIKKLAYTLKAGQPYAKWALRCRRCTRPAATIAPRLDRPDWWRTNTLPCRCWASSTTATTPTATTTATANHAAASALTTAGAT